MKKALIETQTLHAGCSKVNQNFHPATGPLNQLEMVTPFIYRPSSVKIDARKYQLSVVTKCQRFQTL